MCILLYFLNPTAKDNEFYLILVNIRDEIYDRPTAPARFWDKHPDIIGGCDRERGKEGGTWFAMSRTGKIGALLNVLQPDEEIAADKKGRGFLVTDYVTGNEDCYQYINKVSSEKDNYNGFTLVTLDLSSKKSPKSAFFSNISMSSPEIINSNYLGYQVFGNSTSVEDPWPKVRHARERFYNIVRCHRRVDSKQSLLSQLFTLISESKCHEPDENMKKQGQDKTPDFLRKLSCIYVRMPEYNYGTRSQTIVLIESSGKAYYFEKNRIPRNGHWTTRDFEFEMSFNEEV